MWIQALPRWGCSNISRENVSPLSPAARNCWTICQFKNAKCILLGGEVRDDLESVLGALTEKMISDMYFDKKRI